MTQYKNKKLENLRLRSIKKLFRKCKLVGSKKGFIRTIYPNSCKKPIHEMSDAQFIDYFK